MKGFCSWLMVLLHLQLSILFDVSEAGVTNVTATERSSVTIQLDEQSPKRDITWVTAGGNHFATTKPNENISIRDVRYKGRLIGLKDGSLFMTQLTMEDQGMYRANIRLANGSTSGQNFNLIVTEYIPPNGASSTHSSWHVLPWMSLWLLMGNAGRPLLW